MANTLAITDGGPARNAYELHRTLPFGRSHRLVWIHGARRDSLFADESPISASSTEWGIREDRGLRRLFLGVVTSDVLILHGYYLWWTAPVAALGRLTGSTVLLTPHGSLTAYQRQFSRPKKALFELVLGWALRLCVHEFVTGSDRERAEVLDRFPRSRASIAGVGTELRDEPVAARHWSSPIHLISVSRISPKKRIDLMIGAVGVLSHEGVPVRLTIAGDGDDRLVADLASQVKALGVEDRVEFIGLQNSSQIELLYRRADIFLSPSDDENFGISAAEAVAAGLPVVVSRAVDSMAGLVGRYVTTLDDRSPAAIAKAITAMVREDRGVVVDEAFDASKRFSWDAVASRWLAIGKRLRGVR